MEPEISGAYIGAGASLAAGIGGIITALIANSRAKKANNHAKRANDIAAEALGQAAEANKIAQDANKLSANANQVATLQMAQRTEQHLVEWAADKHVNKSPILMLTNRGRDTAHDVTITVKCGDGDERSHGYNQVPFGGRIEVTLPEPVQDRLGKRKVLARIEDSSTYGPVVQNVQLEIHWVSELGNPHKQTLEVKVK